jgi:hypothetical protein
LFLIGTTTLSEEIVSLLNVRVLKIRSIEEFDLELGTLNQTVVEVVPSIMKLKDFCVRRKVSLKYKVCPKTYYHN